MFHRSFYLSLLLCLFVLVTSCDRQLETDPSHLSIEVPTDPFLQKDGLKILDIGNSYTDDATDLLPLLVKAANVDISGFCIYKATRGGASFKSWYNIYNDADGASKYFVSKVVGDSDNHVPTGKGSGNDGELFRRVLSEVKWDLIIIHQRSDYAPYYELWGTNRPGGYLQELLSIIREHQPKAKLGFLLVHSYSSDFENNKEKSSFERWVLISQSVKSLCSNYNIDYVIPYGTAIQNLRASSLNDQYDLTRDGKHCALGLCRYTAACCYYESLIAPRTGVSVLGNSARYKVPANSDYHSSYNVTDNNAYIAQRAAVLACDNWLICNNPED